ncbi:MAG: response regulator [Myxococcota bacterium]
MLRRGGFTVAVETTAFAAWTRLELDGDYDVILAEWDEGHRTAVEVYRWALDNRHQLCGQFIFLAETAPPDFDQIVHGRCLLLDPREFEEIVRVTEATSLRARFGRRDRAAWQPTAVARQPAAVSLLLVEDEPLQQAVMRCVLTSAGFAVTITDCGNAAITELMTRDYDVILSDWYMANGSGGELYRWLLRHRPHLASRCVFMSASDPAEWAILAPTRPMLPKGQDMPALLHQLNKTARGSTGTRAWTERPTLNQRST